MNAEKILTTIFLFFLFFSSFTGIYPAVTTQDPKLPETETAITDRKR